ncbi:hypothetical protein D3OALGA1CA_4923 [Olavius algarvensis associated proteobacterium Delta 3]|nr:hypothetical protein D3OALGA1CA_4923 [Olavius algarvensis associated proteobacterium Delta 3]
MAYRFIVSFQSKSRDEKVRAWGRVGSSSPEAFVGEDFARVVLKEGHRFYNIFLAKARPEGVFK